MLQFPPIPDSFISLIQSLDFDQEALIGSFVLRFDSVIAFIEKFVTIVKRQLFAHKTHFDPAIVHIENGNVKMFGIAITDSGAS